MIALANGFNKLWINYNSGLTTLNENFITPNSLYLIQYFSMTFNKFIKIKTNSKT